MLQKFQTQLAQVKARNTSENLLNEIRQNIYCHIDCIYEFMNSIDQII